MRPEVLAAERKAAVREAARAWRKAGWISEAAEAAIHRRFADDRHRQGPALRTLLFVLTWFGVWSGLGAFLALFQLIAAPAPLLLVVGAGCIALAELAYGHLKLLDYGPESALSWCGVGFLLAGFGWMLFEVVEPPAQLGLLTMLGFAAVILGLGAWRWGSWLMALFAGSSLLGIFAGLPLGRLWWIVAGLAGAVLSLRAAENGALGPSHRRCFRALFALALVAVALALFPQSNEGNWIEKLGLRRGDASPLPLLSAWLGSMLFSLVLLLVAIHSRRRLLLGVGALLAAALIALLVAERDVRPYWAILCGAGLALVGGALGLRRFLASGADGERGGFTAAALLDDPESRRLLEAAVAMATASPAARPQPHAATPTLQGRGGEFGGGGASSEF